MAKCKRGWIWADEARILDGVPDICGAEADMHAKPGDVLIVESQTVDQQQRQATILEVRSPDGSPPYFVRWRDGHEGLIYPGPDAHVAAGEQHWPHRRPTPWVGIRDS
jgi:hypothetical protein